MRKALIILGVALLLGIVAGFVLLVCHLPQKEMVVQGDSERDWIKSIAYHGPDQQTEAWRELGQPGLKMLVRALWRGNGTIDRNYPNFYNRLPSYIRQRLPTPHDDTNMVSRMCAADLLCSLKTNAASVAPELVRVMKVETRDSVLQLELNCFGDSGQLLTLPGMDRVKAELLPVIIRASASKNWATRTDALIPLRYYTNRSEAVVPLLVASLKDPSPEVRFSAISSLRLVNPQKAVEAGGVDVLIEIFKTGSQSTIQLAARELGQWREKPELLVPVLIEAARGTNELLAMAAVNALGNFPGHARTLPVLQELAHGSLPSLALVATRVLDRMTNQVGQSSAR